MVVLAYFSYTRDSNMFGSCYFLFSAQVRAPIEHLVGHFASGMTSLLGKLVEGWTTLNGSDSDAVARQSHHLLENRQIDQLAAVADTTTIAPRSSLTRKRS